MATTTLTNHGRAVLARALSLLPLHLAWGTGNPAWDDLPESDLPSLVDATTLTAEIGRRKVATIDFVEEAEDGDIVIPVNVRPNGQVESVRYRRAEGITPNLHMTISFDYEDAPTATIRELALFAETEPAEGLPPGQMYFTPEQLKSAGHIIAGQILRPAILRSPSNREIVEIVLPI